MGILDSVMDAWGNAGNGTNMPRDAYLQALAGGLLSGRSNNFGVNLGTSMLGAQGAAAAERERLAKEQLQQAQAGHFQQQDASARAAIAEKMRILQEQQRLWNPGSTPDANNNLVGQPLPAPTQQVRVPTWPEITRAKGAGAFGADDLALLKQMTDKDKFETGGTYRDRITGKEEYFADPNKQMTRGTNGQPVEQQGVAEAMARAAGMTERAKSDATSATDVVTINQNGVPTIVTKQALRGMQPDASMPLTGGQPGQPSAPISTLQSAGSKVKADVGMNGNPEHMRHVFETAIGMNIRPDIALRLIGQESNWDVNARSTAGAGGLGQLMPGTANELGVNPADWKQNIEGSLRYFKQQLDTNKGDYGKALAAYNAGPGRVRQAGGIPNIPETIDHGQRIMGGPLGDSPSGAQAPSTPKASTPPGVFQGTDPAITAGREAALKSEVTQVGASFTKAQGAASSINQLNQISEVMDTANAKIGGPLMAWKQAALRGLKQVGIEGPKADEWLAARTSLLQSTSKLAVDGALMIAGQGSVTQFERQMVEKASTPDIDKMTDGEIRAAVSGLRKSHAYQLDQHNTALSKVTPGIFSPEQLERYRVNTPESASDPNKSFWQNYEKEKARRDRDPRSQGRTN